MRGRKNYVQCLLILMVSARAVLTAEESTVNITSEEADSHTDYIAEPGFSSSTISEKVPESIGIPTNNHPHHHEKSGNPTDTSTTHRRPVYEAVNQPCYSPGCGGFGPKDGYVGNRWQPGRNRHGPYPKYYEPRRRGGYGYREMYPSPGYGPSYGQGYGPGYGSPYPEYGYGPRAMPFYPQDKYDRFVGYGRQPYDDYFLG